MTRDQQDLAQAGELLLGSEWRQPLARLLGPRHPSGPRDAIDGRLVQRWAAGQRPIPGWVWPVLADMLADRRVEILDTLDRIDSMSAHLRCRDTVDGS